MHIKTIHHLVPTINSSRFEQTQSLVIENISSKHYNEHKKHNLSQDCTSIGKAKSTYDSMNGFSGVSEGSINVSSTIDMEIAPGKKKN